MGYNTGHFYVNGGSTCQYHPNFWIPGVGAPIDGNDTKRNTVSGYYYSLFGRYGEWDGGLTGVEFYVYDWVANNRTSTYIRNQIYTNAVGTDRIARDNLSLKHVWGGTGFCPPVCSPISASLSTNKDSVVNTGSDSAILTWTYGGDNITGISINGTNVASLSQLVVAPTVQTTYTLTVTNLCGQSATSFVTIDVIPVPHTISYFRANDKSPTCPVYLDEAVVFSWSTLFNTIETSTGVSIDNGVGTVPIGVGQKVISAPLTDTTYTLTSTGIDGTTLNATVDVTLLEYDDTPDAYAFNSVSNAEVSTLYESNFITVTGIETLVDAFSTNDSEIRLNGGAWTSGTITGIDNGDTLQVRMPASSLFATKKTASISIGDTSSTWNITTKTEPATLPNPFEFDDVTDAPILSYVESNAVTITGITQGVVSSPSNTDFECRVNQGSWTNLPQTIANGETIQLRVFTSNVLGELKSTQITVGDGAARTWNVTNVAVADNSPDFFDFLDKINQQPNTLIESEYVTITGINVPTNISCSNSNASIVVYDPTSGNTTSYGSATTIVNNQQVKIRLTSSSDPGGEVNTNVTIGNSPLTQLTDIWRVFTTTAGDLIPDAFYFVGKDNQPPNTLVLSNTVLISGITSPSPISITNGEFRLNGGNWVSTGNLNNGDTLQLRILTAPTLSTAKTMSITIG